MLPSSTRPVAPTAASVDVVVVEDVVEGDFFARFTSGEEFSSAKKREVAGRRAGSVNGAMTSCASRERQSS